ncbi:beta-N-acetylhexosaminidase [Phyllobacterium sp. 21LDTY02-6]|uniref:beta-N-acetylhexosaminidase n=1 Tax=unclassified Phyllobacterium TaxID=2638441 RepID=UPI002021F294|nr:MULTISPECIES: beta-N-acetylhexosaminidase [unclassified Phyllobacterium]MCO4316391.1 beta-N-acetylhexosaminidase [Phyllobacterium sp. 21LDTY02-6]MCX8280806.1 beta-N-acetylhexosaminidase [Phyllobacterium sp. 0TCS1.6C]MCX8292617.1 beta-N-acetylhexosaminidase [Phyllobacterium sp. 0TCS1.6A]
MSESKAWIAGTSGTKLTPDEIAFFADERPWGFILFARNVSERAQIEDLCGHLRHVVRRDDAPILIDQEGGRVQRLRPPLAPDYPAGAALGALYRSDEELGLRAAWLLSRLHAFDLLKLGIDVDCLPVLDVPVEGANDVIGARAYAKEPAIVAAMGAAAAEGLLAGGMLPIMKHIPGHGRAFADTHHELPTVTTPFDDLAEHDFAPFKALAHLPMAMSAHVIFSAIDPQLPATTSGKVVEEVIRGHIGFEGLLMSDDVSMNALSGDYVDRSKAIYAAGLDMVLHCHGIMDQMRAVASVAPDLQGRTQERARQALACRRKPDACIEEELREEFGQMFEAVA